MNEEFLKRLDELVKLDESILGFVSAIKKNESDYNAWNALGNVLSQNGDHDDAIQCYDIAIQIDPNNADAWNGKGNVLFNLERFDEAIKCYDKAIEIDPSNADAWNNRGVPLESMGKFDEAIQSYDKATKLDPRYFNGWYNKGLVLAKLESFDKAIKCYDKAIEIDPDSTDAWYHRGSAFHGLKKYHDAILCYDNAIEIDIMYVSAWYSKGLSLSNLERYLEAIQCFDKALEIDPNNAGASYERGNSYNSLGYYDEAIKSYDKALAIDPNNAKALYKKGSILLNNNKFEEAESCLQKSLSSDEKDISVLKKLHTIYSNHTNQYDKAIEIAQKLVQSDQSSEMKTLYAADLIKAGKYKEGRASAQDAFAGIQHKKVESQLVLRFLTISSYLLDGNLSNAEKELDKFLKYYKSLEDIYFNVDDEQLDFQGFTTIIENSKIKSQSKATLYDLLNLLHGESDRRVLVRIASTFADKNVKSRRRLKVLVPTLAAVSAIAIMTIVILASTRDNVPECSPLKPLPQGVFAKEISDVGIDSARHLAYVLSSDSDFTAVVDTCTNDLVEHIETGKGVALAVNPDTNKIYVANEDANKVSVVDLNNKTDDRANVKRITGVERPSDIVIDKENKKIYVSNRGSNFVSIIDGSTDQQIKNLTVGKNPIDLDIDTKNHIVYTRSAREPFVIGIQDRTADRKGFASFNITLNYIANGMAVDSNGLLYLGKPPEIQSNKGNLQEGIIEKILQGNSQRPQGNLSGKIFQGTPQGNLSLKQIQENPQEDPLSGKINIINMSAYGVDNLNKTKFLPPKEIQSEITMEEFGQGINMLADPKKDLLYLISKDINTVSIIDTNSKRLMQTIHVGNNPSSISMDSEGGKIYVTSEDDEGLPVVVIDANQLQNQVDTLKVDSSPTGIAIDPETSMIYVANFDSDSVTVISGDSHKVNKTISLKTGSPQYPISIAINPYSHMVYVANFLNNSVSVINGTNNTIVKTVPVGNRPSGIDIDPEKNMLYVANQNSSTVSVIDTKDNEPIQDVKVGSKPVDISVDPSRHMIYVANFGSNNTSVIDGTKNNTVVQTMQVGNRPSGIDIDPEKNMLYVANQDSETVSAINMSKNRVSVKEFNVSVNNGSGQTCSEMKVIDNITAIGHDGANEPRNVLDDDPDTAWSNFGSGSWIRADLGTQKNICGIDIQWYKNKIKSNQAPYNFEVSVSNDGAKYTNVFTGGSLDLALGKNDVLTYSYNGASSQLNNTNSTSPVSARYIRINITDIAGLISPIGEEVDQNVADPLHSNIKEWPDTIGTYKNPEGINALTSPTDVVFDNETNMIYVTNQDSNWVSPINDRGFIFPPIHVGKNPIGLAIDPKNNTMYVANWGSDTVSIISRNMTS